MERLLLVGSVVTMALGGVLLWTEHQAAGVTIAMAGFAVGAGTLTHFK